MKVNRREFCEGLLYGGVDLLMGGGDSESNAPPEVNCKDPSRKMYTLVPKKAEVDEIKRVTSEVINIQADPILVKLFNTSADGFPYSEFDISYTVSKQACYPYSPLANWRVAPSYIYEARNLVVRQEGSNPVGKPEVFQYSITRYSNYSPSIEYWRFYLRDDGGLAVSGSARKILDVEDLKTFASAYFRLERQKWNVWPMRIFGSNIQSGNLYFSKQYEEYLLVLEANFDGMMRAQRLYQ